MIQVEPITNESVKTESEHNAELSGVSLRASPSSDWFGSCQHEARVTKNLLII